MADNRDNDDEEQNDGPFDPILALLDLLTAGREKTKTEPVKTNRTGQTSTQSSRTLYRNNSSVSSGSRSSLSVNSAVRTSTASQLSNGKRTSSASSYGLSGGTSQTTKSMQSTKSHGSKSKCDCKRSNASARPLDGDDDDDDDEEQDLRHLTWATKWANKRPTASASARPLPMTKAATTKGAIKQANPPHRTGSTSPYLPDLNLTSSTVKQRARIQPPKCNLLSQELTLANRDTTNAMSKQNEDIRKSFDERAKLVATLQTFRVQLADSIKHALDAKNSGKSN